MTATALGLVLGLVVLAAVAGLVVAGRRRAASYDAAVVVRDEASSPTTPPASPPATTGRLDYDSLLHYDRDARTLVVEHDGRVPVHDVRLWLDDDPEPVATWPHFDPGERLPVPYDAVARGHALRDQGEGEHFSLPVLLRCRRASGEPEQSTWDTVWVA